MILEKTNALNFNFMGHIHGYVQKWRVRVFVLIMFFLLFHEKKIQKRVLICLIWWSCMNVWDHHACSTCVVKELVDNAECSIQQKHSSPCLKNTRYCLSLTLPRSFIYPSSSFLSTTIQRFLIFPQKLLFIVNRFCPFFTYIYMFFKILMEKLK